jgi:hypothetical protein
MPGRVIEALRRHELAQQQERRSATVWTETGLVFTTGVGTVIDPSNLRQDWASTNVRNRCYCWKTDPRPSAPTGKVRFVWLPVWLPGIPVLLTLAMRRPDLRVVPAGPGFAKWWSDRFRRPPCLMFELKRIERSRRSSTSTRMI